MASDVERLMKLVERAVPTPKVEIIMHRSDTAIGRPRSSLVHIGDPIQNHVAALESQTMPPIQDVSGRAQNSLALALVAWSILDPLMPELRNRAGGRARTDMRAAMNAILYILRMGCPWRYLPRDGFPPRSTV